MANDVLFRLGSSEMTTECTTTDVCMIITSLQPNTTYQVQVSGIQHLRDVQLEYVISLCIIGHDH